MPTGQRYDVGMQGVIKSYDPVTRQGLVITDTDLSEFELADGAIEGSVFRMLRPGQRVNFVVDEEGFAAAISIGSEIDMATPAWITEGH